MCRCLPPVHPVAFLIVFAQTSLCCGLYKLTTLALVGMTLSVQLPVMEMWLADNQRPFGGYGCFPALALGGAPPFPTMAIYLLSGGFPFQSLFPSVSLHLRVCGKG